MAPLRATPRRAVPGTADAPAPRSAGTGRPALGSGPTRLLPPLLAVIAVCGLAFALAGPPGDFAAARGRSDFAAARDRSDGAAAGPATACVTLGRAGAPGAAATGAGAPDLEPLFAILVQSRTARAALRQARRHGVKVCLDAETELLGYYFANQGVIGVSTALTEGAKIAFLAHELGHVPQHPTYSDNRFFRPEDLVLLRRMREAVAEAVATRIAWELRQAGYRAAWDEKIATPYGDVARAFEAALGVMASPLPRGMAPGAPETALLRATRAAFDRWFMARWRLEVYDAMTLDHLQRISADALGLVPPRRRLDDGFLAGVARLEGHNFLAQTTGRPLTGPYYAAALSAANASRLERILYQAALDRPAAPPASRAGLDS